MTLSSLPTFVFLALALGAAAAALTLGLPGEALEFARRSGWAV